MMKPAPAMSRRRLTDGTVEQAAAANVMAAMNVNMGSIPNPFKDGFPVVNEVSWRAVAEVCKV